MNEFSSMQSAANSQDASAATAVRKTAPTIDAETDDRRSLVLLLSLLFFLVLSAFVRDDWISEVVLALAVYAILVIAIVKISVERALPWPVLLLTASSLVVTIISIFCPMHTLQIANWLMLSIFFWLCLPRFFPVSGKGRSDQQSQIRRVPGPLSDSGHVLPRDLQLDAGFKYLPVLQSLITSLCHWGLIAYVQMSRASAVPLCCTLEPFIDVQQPWVWRL
jgi:hypothetical protein